MEQASEAMKVLKFHDGEAAIWRQAYCRQFVAIVRASTTCQCAALSIPMDTNFQASMQDLAFIIDTPAARWYGNAFPGASQGFSVKGSHVFVV